jgi:hypothetical protein
MTIHASDCGCKVGRLRREYELSSLDERIQHRREEEEASLRDLASFVNTRVLESTLDRRDVDVVGDPESVYEALTGDDVPPERTVRVRNELTDVDIDVEDLENDFVSYQTVRSHLNDCLDIDTSRRGVDTVDEARSLVEWTRSRDENVVSTALERLHRIGELSIGDISVTTDVVVTCKDCGAAQSVDSLLNEGGCDC